MQAMNLKRFKAAKAKTRVHLYKQAVLPIMEYPPIPTYALSKSKLATLQRIQNRVLSILRNLISFKIHYWRTLQKSKTETNKSKTNPKGK